MGGVGGETRTTNRNTILHLEHFLGWIAWRRRSGWEGCSVFEVALMCNIDELSDDGVQNQAAQFHQNEAHCSSPQFHPTLNVTRLVNSAGHRFAKARETKSKIECEREQNWVTDTLVQDVCVPAVKLRSSIVAVMQTAGPRLGNHLTTRHGTNSAARRFLAHF